jgi:hypothetical protein
MWKRSIGFMGFSNDGCQTQSGLTSTGVSPFAVILPDSGQVIFDRNFSYYDLFKKLARHTLLQFCHWLVLGFPTVTQKGAVNRSSIKGFAALFFFSQERWAQARRDEKNEARTKLENKNQTTDKQD